MSAPGALSFCRLCMGHCGVVVTLDERQRLHTVRGDHGDPQTQGYACFKGMMAPEAHNSPERILHPLKRMPDGTFQPIPPAQALDEIAAKLGATLAGHGPEALAGYKGGGGFFCGHVTDSFGAFVNADSDHLLIRLDNQFIVTTRQCA